MSLSTLTRTKTHLGISGTTEDTLLAQLIGNCSDAIRTYTKKWLGAFVISNTVANPTVLTCYGHGLQTGDSITISGSNCSPTIDGARTVTWLSADTFSVAVNVTTAGTAGYFSKTFTEFYSGNGTRYLHLRQSPVQSVTSVYEDQAAYYGEASGSFAAASLLTAGTDYALRRDNANATEKSLSGIIERIGTNWTMPTGGHNGLLTAIAERPIGNIKVTYVAGYAPLPVRFQMACEQYVAIMRRIRTTGAALTSEQYDYYNYTLSATADQANELGSVRQLLSSDKAWVW